MPAPDNVRRYFLPWGRPLLPQAIAFLVGDWAGPGPLDLSHLLVVVPTRQSGRRLREALAAHAAKQGAAVFPPSVMMPELLLAPQIAEDAASPMETLLAWVDVFRALPLDEFRAVFPVDPPARTFSWALRLASEFNRLERALAEAGLGLGDVADRLGADFPEAERWRQIAGLEARHQERLVEGGRRDVSFARREHLQDPPLPVGIKRIVLLAAPDPSPPALLVLNAYAHTVPVDVVVFAPADLASAFDGWGRPLDSGWATRVFALNDFEQRVQLCAHPAAQADKIAETARAYGEPEGALAVGVADPEVLPLLENSLEHAGLAVFNPEGRRRKGDALFQLLTALAALAREESFSVVESLARCPDFLDFLAARCGSNVSHAVFLGELDALHARHLPTGLKEAIRHAPQNQGLAAIVELRSLLRDGKFPESAIAALNLIFRDRRFDLQNSLDTRAAECGEIWVELLRESHRAAKTFESTEPADWWELALRMYGESVRYDDKPANAVELQGWLELLWEDAPHLIVAGLNDGRVPDAIVGDPFLPEELRIRLGLKTNAARFARDAYVLQALAACRVDAGQINLLVGKTSLAGEPLRPSRLLLRCDDEDLPGRVRFLFGPAQSLRAGESWRRAWKLEPPPIVPPPRIAVTSFRSWLECPFRFYLSRVLRMEAVDAAKSELDVFDFGTLCHSALEAMGLEPALKNCTDPKTVREFLLHQLEIHAAARFGRELTLPLVVQLESARQRLSRLAELQAQTRAEGWVIETVERKFEIDVGGLVVVAKIDRIDRHEATGAVRVLDYKTSDRPVDPWQAHLRSPRRDETPLEFSQLVYNAKDYVWSDLQLPLYQRAVRGWLADDTDPIIELGYFNLPKAASETGVRPWENYTRELEESAWRCALGVSAAIQRGEYWPPNETIRPERDEFGSLFHDGVEASVSWKGLLP